MTNKAGFAVHNLSTAKVTWPPPNWCENDLFRDSETRLPLQLYPFVIGPEYKRDDPTGDWELCYAPKDGLPDKQLGTYPDIWVAFEAMWQAYREWFPRRPAPQVYFIGTQLKVGKMLKVGFSLNPVARLRQLQTSNPERLQLFASIPGDENLERKYHSRWRARRMAGEWFIIGDAIIREVERLRSLTTNTSEVTHD